MRQPECLNLREPQVWRIPLAGDPECHIRNLSPDELDRLGRLRGERRDRFAISHGATREILATYLGCNARDVPLTCRYGEPPTVPSLCLSLSHTDGLALLAVAHSPIGVDAEAVPQADDEDLELLARATLAWSELRDFLGAPVERRGAIWLRFWVRKEAVLKAAGLGLADRVLCELDVSEDLVDGYELVDLDAGLGYQAAIAVRPPLTDVRLREWVDEPR